MGDLKEPHSMSQQPIHKTSHWFEYFPENHMWSQGMMFGIEMQTWGAASISEIDDTPTTDAPATARSAAAASAWAVQIGAFKVETEANTKRDQLRQAGFAAFVEKINADAGVLWRVRIGPENKRADADAVKAGVKRRFGIDGIVVPYP